MQDNHMPTELAFDAMEKIIPHLSAVLNDAEIKGHTEYLKTDEGKEQKAGDLMMVLLPLFVGKHREAMFNIVAIFKGMSVEEVKKMDFRETLEAMKNNFLGEMMLFFIYCLNMVNVR